MYLAKNNQNIIVFASKQLAVTERVHWLTDQSL